MTQTYLNSQITSRSADEISLTLRKGDGNDEMICLTCLPADQSHCTIFDSSGDYGCHNGPLSTLLPRGQINSINAISAVEAFQLSQVSVV